MPREIVHWCVLERAAENAKTAGLSSLSACLSEYRSAAMLGAVAHDAPYYYNYGGDVFEHAAQALHGSYRNNPLVAMADAARWIISDAPEEKKPLLWSMLAGMLSHIATDVVFHPMVIYFTGDYYDPNFLQRKKSRTRHRLFEVYLDSWFLAHEYQPRTRRLRSYLEEVYPDRSDIGGMLNQMVSKSTVFGDKERAVLLKRLKQDAWTGSLRDISKIQGWLISSAAGAAFRLLNLGTLGKLGSLEALASFGRMKPQVGFDSALEFKNPVSGSPASKTVTELCAQAVSLCDSYFAHLEDLISGAGVAKDQIFSEFEGRSLEFGLAGVNHEDANHFSANGINMPGLSY